MNIKDARIGDLVMQRIGWYDYELIEFARYPVRYKEVPRDPRIDTLWYYPSVDLLFVKTYDVLYTVGIDDKERFLYMPGPGTVPKQLVYVGEM